mgnify:CR=1 FL=1
MRVRPAKFLIFFLILIFPSLSFADSYLEKKIFFIDKNYDFLKREKVLATNLLVSPNAYFYLEDDFWGKLSQIEKEKLYQSLKNLAQEFDSKIYSRLTFLFGKEMERGPNGDPKITILFHKMKEDAAGYVRENDFFEKSISPNSNERKMIYLNADLIGQEILTSDLAHEFCHLISFNQKSLILKVEEERWVLEMFSEICPTVLGYSQSLKQRIEIFKKYPKDALLEWQDSIQDYASLSIFAHYLLDQFGSEFYKKILSQKETGYLTIEKATQKKFEQIFKNFLLALYLGDCNFGKEYCFSNENLKNFKILPEFHFLPKTGETVFTVFRKIKDFSGDWQKIYGGKGNLKLDFKGEENSIFDITLLLCDKSEKCQIKDFALENGKKGSISIPTFSENYSSFALISFSKTSFEFFERESAPERNFSIKISFTQATTSETAPPLPPAKPKISCQSLTQNLRYGMSGDQVKCLQEFLKLQGSEIYPEGLVTGYFGPLTFAAVKRFQQKYWQEILAPWGLTKDQPTGFVGPTTRAKINKLLAQI